MHFKEFFVAWLKVVVDVACTNPAVVHNGVCVNPTSTSFAGYSNTSSTYIGSTSSILNYEKNLRPHTTLSTTTKLSMISSSSSAVKTSDLPTGSGSTGASSSAASSSAASSSTSNPGSKSYTGIVAFGDNLSDTGDGSVKYNVAVNRAREPTTHIYSETTWSDHQVAVYYLAGDLGVPLTENLAFGHAFGGGDSGATIDDKNWKDGTSNLWHSNFSQDASVYFPTEFAEPTHGAPSSRVQIKTYLQQHGGEADSNALYFLWTGNNDPNLYTMYRGDGFKTDFGTALVSQVQTLLSAGAQRIFVPNIYAKELSPLLPAFYGMHDENANWQQFADFMTATNAAAAAAMQAAKFDAQKVLYYDVHSFMTDLWNNGASHGFSNMKDSNGWPAFCDGDPNSTDEVTSKKLANNWALCVDQQMWNQWYWMEYLDMTSEVHRLIAGDMAAKIKALWG